METEITAKYAKNLVALKGKKECREIFKRIKEEARNGYTFIEVIALNTSQIVALESLGFKVYKNKKDKNYKYVISWRN